MRVGGIDPDSHAITIFVVDNNGHDDTLVDRLRLEAKGQRAEDRFLGLVHQMQELLPNSILRGCNFIWVERPFVGPNRKAAIDLGMVVGALRYAIDRLGVPHTLVDPSTWKSAMLGTNRVSKEDIKAWAIARYGLPDNLVQDVYDSSVIAAFGLMRLTGGNGRKPHD
jgi:Holliday junction resolvasome RuvABC endonuclease subunit